MFRMYRDIFLFAGGAVLTALAVLYGNMSMLWEVVLWGGVAVMVIAAVHGIASAYYRLASTDKPPILILTGADIIILGLIVTAFWVPSPAAPAPAPPVAPVQPPPAPPAKEVPCVTQDDIDAQKS